MKTNAELAQLASDVYFVPTNFTLFDTGETIGKDGVCYGLLKTPNENIISLRGSLVLRDWILDLVAIANPLHHSVFGPIHPGFALNMDKVADELYKEIDHSLPVTITGHSLGAGRAAILTAMFLQRGIKPKSMRRVVFGEPKPGFKQLADYISEVPSWSYRNGDSHFHDAVTSLPFTFPFIEEYTRCGTLLGVCEPPSQSFIDKLAMFSWHHIALYAAGLRKLGLVRAVLLTEPIGI